jgi:plasmid stabilization system protein ParE
MSVSWTEKSIADLEAIRRYLTGSSVSYGHSFIDRIISRAESDIQVIAVIHASRRMPKLPPG